VSEPLRAAWRRLKLELVIAYVHGRTLATRSGSIARFNRQSALRLHLGSGDVRKPGWVNVDIHPAADLRLDVRRTWPFADGSAAEAYAEHLFEHLAWPGEVSHFLGEARRVLRSGGTLRLSVPDLGRHVRAYMEHDAAFRAAFTPFLPVETVTWADALNHHFRQQGEHLYSYDADTLADRLRAAGFEQPSVVAPSPDYEQPSRDFESLVMTARRP
jgi:predicted SAM-dependent methyltransferase